jgi:hypothetical protein
MRSLSVCSVVRRVLASVGGDSDVRLVLESRQPGSHLACRPALARPARCSSLLFGLVGARSQPGQRKNLFGCPSYKPFHVVRSFLHRPSLAGWRRRIFLHPASLARRHLSHRAGLAQTLLQATNQDHGASSEPGWLICRQPNTPVSLGPALHCTWACNCAEQDMSLQLNRGSSSTTTVGSTTQLYCTGHHVHRIRIFEFQTPVAVARQCPVATAKGAGASCMPSHRVYPHTVTQACPALQRRS